MSLITGLEVIYGHDTPPPTGYQKIPVDLNKGAGGQYIYLCYSIAQTGEGPITGIQVFAANCAEPTIQSGYTKIPKDLNKGAGGRYIYICYTRDKSLPPIAEVNVLQGSYFEVYPPSVEWIRDNQDCSQCTREEYTYITYRRVNARQEVEAAEAELRTREAELRAREAEARAGE